MQIYIRQVLTSVFPRLGALGWLQRGEGGAGEHWRVSLAAEAGNCVDWERGRNAETISSRSLQVHINPGHADDNPIQQRQEISQRICGVEWQNNDISPSHLENLKLTKRIVWKKTERAIVDEPASL